MKRFLSMLLYHIGLMLISLAYALDSNLLANLLADAIASKPGVRPGDGYGLADLQHGVKIDTKFCE